MAKQPEIVTRAQLAKIWGVSPSAIDNLVQRKLLPKSGHGTFNLKEAEKARASLRPTANRTDRIIREAREEAAANVQAPAVPDAPGLQVIEGGKAGKPIADAKVAELSGTLARARTTREIFTARSAELNYKKEAGLVIETEKVKHAAANASRLIVARLRSFPSRLGPQLAPITNSAECVKTIETEVRGLIEEFQEMMASL